MSYPVAAQESCKRLEAGKYYAWRGHTNSLENICYILKMESNYMWVEWPWETMVTRSPYKLWPLSSYINDFTEISVEELVLLRIGGQ
jgi:hypothetical protein